MKFSWRVMAVLTVMVAALFSYGAYYVQGIPTEEHEVTKLCSYGQNIRCNYTAYLKPNMLYGDAIGEGETIYIKLAERIDVTFNYTFSCSVEGSISTDYEIRSFLEESSENGWRKPIDELVSVETAETENVTSATLIAKFSYNITEINELIEKIEEDIGYASSTYQIVTNVGINTTDETAIETISKTVKERIVLKLNYMGGYMERAGVIEIEAPEKHLPGSITENRVKKIESAVYLKTAINVALAAWIVAGCSLTAWRYRTDRTRFETFPESERIMKRFKAIESRGMPDMKAVTLSSIEDLKRLVDDYDLTMFHTKMTEGDVFFTIDNNIVYRYVTRTEGPEHPDCEKMSAAPPKGFGKA